MPNVFEVVRAQGTQHLLLLQQDTAGSIVWANDNETLFYVTKDKLDRPYKVQAISSLGPFEFLLWSRA